MATVAIQHAVADKTIRDRQDPTHDTNERILLVLLIIFPTGNGLLDLGKRRPQEPQSEEEEDPREARNEGCAQQDKHEAQQQRDHNAEKQRLLLILTRNAEGLQNQDKHKQVIDRQRPLHRPARIKLLGVEPAVGQPNSNTKMPANHVEQGPASSLASRGRVWITRVPEEIEHDQTDGNEGENAPRPRMNNHEYLLTIQRGNFSALPHQALLTHAVCEKPRERPRP